MNRRGAETAWTFLAIDLHSPYEDNRPLLVAGQPEKRSCRVRFWDGEPQGDYSDIHEVTFGG